MRGRIVRGVGLVALMLLVFTTGCGFIGESPASEAVPAVEHQVHDGEAPEHAIPGSVSEVAWEWETGSEDVDLQEVLPGAAGPVMVLSDGVVSLDGVSGEEMWSYRLESGGLRGARMTPDHQQVLLTLPGNEPDTAVLLDSGTGRLIAEHEDVPGETFARASVLTSQVAVAAPPQGEGPVEAYSLREGELEWTYEPSGRADGTKVLVEDVVSAGGTVVVIMADDLADVQNESGDFLDQGMLAAGLDAETGEPLWEVEREFADEVRRVAEHELSPGAEVLHLEVGVGNQRHEFLIDPETGEEIEGAAYQERERYPVGLLDDGYVESAADYDAGTVEYWHMSFGGEELGHMETRRRAAEGDIDSGLLLEEGVLRPDYLTSPDLGRGPVDVEFVGWGAQGESMVLNADMTVNQEWWLESEGSAVTLPDAPELVLVPGAVVVTEENSGPWTVVGLT